MTVARTIAAAGTASSSKSHGGTAATPGASDAAG
eukprot:COSAG06_NODE_65225_length_257_cov_1.050633_1_plen_33_part_01